MGRKQGNEKNRGEAFECTGQGIRNPIFVNEIGILDLKNPGGSVGRMSRISCCK
jgi:hypothetical protein